MSGSEDMVRTRRKGAFAFGIIALFVVAVGSFLVGQRFFEPQTALAGSANAASAREPGRTSPTTTVGSGNAGGKEWSLRAYTAASDQDDFLCLEWKFGRSTVADDFNCFGPLSELLAKGGAYGPISAISQPGSGNSLPRSAFFGVTPSSTQQVVIALENGSTASGRVLNAPAELSIDARFFVAFAPPDMAVTVTAYDDSGNQLWTEDETPMPTLTVRKQGGGRGTITGVPTDQLRGLGPENPRLTRWIDCGNTCLVALSDASITLDATPAEGSIFTGWKGACSGTRSCVLVIDSDKVVTATFEPAP